MITLKMTPKEELIQLVDKSLQGDKFSLAKLISIFENTKPEFYEYKKIIIDYLKEKNFSQRIFCWNYRDARCRKIYSNRSISIRTNSTTRRYQCCYSCSRSIEPSFWWFSFGGPNTSKITHRRKADLF